MQDIKDNIWVADLAEIGSLSSNNKNLNTYIMCHRCFH